MRKLIIDALFPKTRQAILSACLLQPDKWWYLSDLAKFLELTPSSLQRELVSLRETEILISRKEGNMVYYKANLECPIIDELQMLLVKTVGIVDTLKAKLIKYLKKVDFSFIYGSIARGEFTSTSDLDLMIIGNITTSELIPSLKRIEKSLGREVNITIYSTEEFQNRIKKEDSFIETILSDKKIFLKGNESELKDLGK